MDARLRADQQRKQHLDCEGGGDLGPARLVSSQGATPANTSGDASAAQVVGNVARARSSAA